MKKCIQAGLVLTVFIVPLIFSHQTTEIYGLIKAVTLECFSFTLLILWLIPLLRRESRAHFSASPLYLPVLSFLAVSALSLIKAANIHLNHIEKISQVQKIMLAGVLAGLVSCGYSVFQNKGINLGASRFGYISTFGNPIFFAQYLVAMIPLSLALCLLSFGLGLRRIFFGLAAIFYLDY